MKKLHATRYTLHAGFTLIEILVVIGMIALLATIVLIAINPARQFAQGRNTQRTSNVGTILNAIGQNMADNKGVFTCGGVTLPPVTTPPVPNPLTAIPAGAKKISSAGGSDINLSCLTPTYIPAGLPFDPSATGAHWNSATDYDTGYYVVQDSAANGSRITVFSATIEGTLSQVNFVAVTR